MSGPVYACVRLCFAPSATTPSSHAQGGTLPHLDLKSDKAVVAQCLLLCASAVPIAAPLFPYPLCAALSDRCERTQIAATLDINRFVVVWHLLLFVSVPPLAAPPPPLRSPQETRKGATRPDSCYHNKLVVVSHRLLCVCLFPHSPATDAQGGESSEL
jgi:hypothetical protein